ncbi:MAG: 30S ribosome-binding factor RbfA [Candidatus Omnitrophota bacterium]
MGRVERVSEALRREISVIIQSGINDPRINCVTITRVAVTRDLKTARIYFVFPEEFGPADKILKGLSRASGFVRGELASRIEMKFVPNLIFSEEKENKNRDRIDALFEVVEKEHAEFQRTKMEGQVMDRENMLKVIDAIKQKDDFLITAHVNPEGDSVGSQIALFNLLEKLGKNAVMVQQDPVPDNLRFLRGSGSVMRGLPDEFIPRTLIVLDCPVKERTGKVTRCLSGEEFTINIDHHVSNEYFGDINWVEPGVSSAGEMIYNIAVEMGLQIDEAMAEALYTSIVTDTGMFNYENTSRSTHEAAGHLISLGVVPNRAHKEVYESKTAQEVRLLGRVLSTLELFSDGKIACIYMTREMCKKEDVDVPSTDEFINFPRSVKGVEISIFLKEDTSFEGRVNVSFRSSGEYDVNVLASRFGGGGHPKASGCVIDGAIDDAKTLLINAAKEIVEKSS